LSNWQKIDRAGLHELFEHHAIGGVLAGCNADGLDRAANRGVTEYVVRGWWAPRSTAD